MSVVFLLPLLLLVISYLLDTSLTMRDLAGWLGLTLIGFGVGLPAIFTNEIEFPVFFRFDLFLIFFILTGFGLGYMVFIQNTAITVLNPVLWVINMLGIIPILISVRLFLRSLLELEGYLFLEIYSAFSAMIYLSIAVNLLSYEWSPRKNPAIDGQVIRTPEETFKRRVLRMSGTGYLIIGWYLTFLASRTGSLW